MFVTFAIADSHVRWGIYMRRAAATLSMLWTAPAP